MFSLFFYFSLPKTTIQQQQITIIIIVIIHFVLFQSFLSLPLTREMQFQTIWIE